MSTTKMTVEPLRNQFGKLSGSYRATFGPWTAVGTTRDEAQLILGEKLIELERHEHCRRTLVTSDRTVFTIYHTFNGWVYDIIHTDKAGVVSASTCMMSTPSFVDAYAQMKSHWEQMEADCAKVVIAL